MTASESRPIIVIGAGIVGAMTAFYLAKRGLEVLVIDAASRPAEVTSHANAGIIAVGHAKSWAGPGAPLQILQALTGRSASVVVTGRPDTALMRWGLSFMMNCTTRAAVRNTGKLQALSRRSRELLPGVAEEVGLGDQMQLEAGLYIFQDHRQFDEYLHSLSSDDRKTLAPLDREELISLDPALAGIGHGLVGGLKSTLDAAGDCRLFTCRALDHAGSRLGVRTLFGQKITGFGVDGQTVHAVRVQNREIPCTAVVVAAGVESTDLLRPLGVSPNIYPVKGYSGTWQITDPAAAPRLPYIDETNLLAVATYGGKLRATFLAEFAGKDRSLAPERTTHLQDYVCRHFGSAIDPKSAEFWTGLRPSTPEGPPYLGRVRKVQNLWINSGHGQLGWTMALASAEYLAARISNDTPLLNEVSAKAAWLA